MDRAWDPFTALGLPRDASGDTIKARYHTLARKYHPNRHQGDDVSKASLSDAFHNVHQAWKLLSKADNRKRRIELLKLLELQDEMLQHYEELLSPESPDEQHSDHHAHESDREGHISSDADEDLPNVGLQRRQTVLTRNPRGLKHLGDRHSNAEVGSPTSPSKRNGRWQSFKEKVTDHKAGGQKQADYFMARRKKLTKLRRRELEAFERYRDAMVIKFEAEEEAERQQEIFEIAKWKREYFERAPRPTTERMRSFLNAMGAVTAFEQHTPRQRNRSSLSYSTMSPVVGPGEGPQFLNPDHGLSRHKSMHRRGWSSDISGDQTSSSEDSGDARRPRLPRIMSPSGSWHHFSKRDRVTYSGNHWYGPNGSSTDSSSGRRPSVEFQLIVRQPTDLATIVETADSSGDTPSASSRTPSPQPINPFDSTKYTVLPSSDTTTLFGAPSERRARSPSPVSHHRAPSLTKLHRPEVHHTTSEGCQFTIERLVTPQHHHVPIAHVHLLSRKDKSFLLGSEPDNQAARPEALLEKLRHLDPDVAAKYEVKPNMEEAFNFRLIYGNREVVSKQHQSFIALSYRRKLQVERHDHHYTLPLEAEIFQAVWDERKSDTEGVWIDQICIKQDDDEERTISMSAMDMVYRSARLVVVALDDIELNAFEGQRLQDHIDEYNSMTHVSPRQRFRHKQPPYLETHEELYRIIRKILGSSWFKRAWCRHEMRLAKHHIFLIPASRMGGAQGRDVLRFNSKSIAHLLDLATEVPWEPEVESVKPALHAFFRDRSKMSPDERQMRSHHGNFSTVVAEVFAMEAGGNPLVPAEVRLSDARKDKIAIILNTMECGLALDRRFRIEGFYENDNDCFHDLSLLALAAGDPGVLCSVGPPLPVSPAESSWLYAPTVADAGLNETKTLERLPDKARFVTRTSGREQYIQLDLKILPKRGARPQVEQEMLDFARVFTDVCEKKEWGRNRKRYLTHDRKANHLFGPMKEIYVQTLACVLHCGPDWMSDVCQRYSMARWKVYLQGAYELLIAFKNTQFKNPLGPYGGWPIHAWDERAAGFLMDFINFLVIRGLPIRQISKPEPWRPLWVDHNGIKVITFAPVSDKEVYPAIPRVLIHTDYVHLARLWMLKPRTEHHEDEEFDAISNNSDWTLLGKSVLFSDEKSIGHMSAYGGDFQNQQRVYGRHTNAPNGVGG